MNFTSFIVGLGTGLVVMVIFLNVVAHDEIESNPNITLSEFWDGK